MKKNLLLKITSVLVLLFILSMSVSELQSYTNVPPAGKCGDPAGGGATCAQCHNSFPVVDVTGWVTSNIPASGYTAGQTYTITCTATQSGISKFGFQISPQSASGALLGTINITNTVETQLASSKYVEHKSAGTTGVNSKTWSFDWVAPASGTGNVSFYACFNCTNGNGNSAGDQIYKTVYTVSECAAIANVNSSNGTSICSGNSTTLTANTGFSYLWNTGATTQSITTDSAGVYSVNVSQGVGCSATSSNFTLNVNQTPSSTISTNDATICGDQSANIIYQGTSNINNNYAWNFNGAVIDTINLNQTYNLRWINAGVYNVKLVVSNGPCVSDTGTIEYTVLQEPTLTFQSTSNTICLGDCFTASANGFDDLYLLPNNSIVNPANFSFCETAIGQFQYTLVGIGANGCDDTASVLFDMVDIPVVALNSSQNHIYVQDSSNISTIEWILDGSLINNSLYSYAASDDGEFIVNITNSNGCQASDTLEFIFSGLNSINNNSVSIYPNPFNDVLNISNPSNENYNVRISDVVGKVIENIAFNVSSVNLNTSKYKSGIYQLQIIDSNNRVIDEHKIVKID